MKGSPALQGIKVADFSWVIVGPMTTKYLADHGATVIRIESHAKPGVVRLMTPHKDGIPGFDRSGTWPNFNSSKYSVALALQKPEGREIAWNLIRWADVVVESFSPGQMKKWGMDYESVRKERPDIIYLSSSARGQTVPYASAPGFAPMLTAMAGVKHLSGWPDRGPSTPYAAYSDFVSPRFAVTAILAALDYRRRTGRGQYLDQSQLESTAHFVAPPVMDYIVNGRIMNRSGNRLSYAAPHGVFRCSGKERWCAIAVFSDAEWERFCGAIGNPAWTENTEFATLQDRKKNEDELERRVENWTSQHTAEEVEILMQEAGVPCSVVQNGSNLIDDPQLKHRGHFRRLEHPILGSYAYGGPAFRLSKTPDTQSAAPCFGQHNEYVFKEILGMSDDEIEDALIKGAVTTEADFPYADMLG